MAGLETALAKRVVNAIKDHYPSSWVLKVHGSAYQRSGIPDLLVCVDGLLIGIELKHQYTGESEDHVLSRVTAAQRREIRKIEEAGGTSGVAWSVDMALDMISQALENSTEDLKRT